MRMKTITIRQKLHHYIEIAEEKKLKAIFTMVENEIEEPYDQWNNLSFVTEMKERAKETEEGKAKMYSWDEVQEKAKQSLQKARNKK